MTTDGERAVGAEEAEAKADLSQTQTDSQTSTSIESGESHSDAEVSFENTLRSLQKQVATLEKKQQSTKDKQLSDTKKELSQVKEAVVNLTKLMQNGVSSPAVSRGNEEQGSSTQLVQEMFVLAGIASDEKAVENTPEYLSFVAANGGRRDVDAGTVTNYLKSLRKSQTQVSAGAVPQPPGGGATPTNTDELTATYERLASDPVGNYDKMAALETQLREAGAWK